MAFFSRFKIRVGKFIIHCKQIIVVAEPAELWTAASRKVLIADRAALHKSTGCDG
jgi:hypothetical protein